MITGNMESVWYALDIKGCHLPHLSSSVKTSEYLLEVMRGKVFRIEKKDLKNAHICKNYQNDLYIKLKELIQKI